MTEPERLLSFVTTASGRRFVATAVALGSTNTARWPNRPVVLLYLEFVSLSRSSRPHTDTPATIGTVHVPGTMFYGVSCK